MRARAAVAWGCGAVAFSGLAGVLLLALLRPAGDLAGTAEAVGFAAVFALFAAMGILLSVRRGDNPIGMIFAAAGAGMALAVFAGSYGESRPGLPGALWALWLGDWTGLLAVGLIPLILLLFPDGTLPSPRWRVLAWVAVIAGPFTALGTALTPGRLSEGTGPPNPLEVAAVGDIPVLAEGGIGWWFLLVAFLGAGAALVVRFRRSRGVRRQQLKWLAFSAALVAVAWLAVVVFWESTEEGSFSVYLLLVPAFASLPVATATAILRYRLYDIDVIINRTLVYGTLTALVTVTYVLTVLVLQRMLTPFTAGSRLAVVGSTLTVATLFRPARVRVQRFVDRRFYRARYDAARTLEGFGERVRTAVDLDTLVAELISAASAAMHPTRVAVWLHTSRKPSQRRARVAEAHPDRTVIAGPTRVS